MDRNAIPCSRTGRSQTVVEAIFEAIETAIEAGAVNVFPGSCDRSATSNRMLFLGVAGIE
jgi:hypothetical protein